MQRSMYDFREVIIISLFYCYRELKLIKAEDLPGGFSDKVECSCQRAMELLCAGSGYNIADFLSHILPYLCLVWLMSVDLIAMSSVCWWKTVCIILLLLLLLF